MSSKKKAPAKKPAPKKPVKNFKPKPAPKKAAAKSPVKKAAPKALKKPAPKTKAAPQKATVKKAKAAPQKGKPAPKKKAAKPIVAIKVAPKKAAAAKPAPKALISKKAVAKAPAPKKAAACKKLEIKATAKKPAPKTNAQHVMEIPTGRKCPKPKAAAGRASEGVFFSIDDLDDFLNHKQSPAPESVKALPEKKKAEPKAAKKAEMKMPAPSKKTLGAASIADILGFNPTKESREKYEEKDVPKKWKKYFKLLMELRHKYSKGIEELSEDVLKRSTADSAGDLSAYGQHLGDAGSESFERDLAFTILSDEKETVAEIDAAIQRMKDGVYGVCEMTGRPIPEQRLLAIPFTRYTREGQEQREGEIRKMKLAAKNAMPGDVTVDIAIAADEDDGSLDR